MVFGFSGIVVFSAEELKKAEVAKPVEAVSTEKAMSLEGAMPTEEAMPIEEAMPMQEVLPTEEVSGKIVSVDVEKSTIVINALVDQEKGTYEDVTVATSDKTVIEKDYTTSSLAELKADEEATVEYAKNDKGEKVASFIWAYTPEGQQGQE